MKTLRIAFSVSCYLIGFAVILYYADFFTGFFVPKAINTGNPDSLTGALMVDFGLILLFAIQHTVMARAGFKRWLHQRIPASISRSIYILLTSAGLVLLIWWWQPIPLVIYDFRGSTAGSMLLALYYLGWVIGLASSFEIDHFALFGLRQAIQPRHEGVQELKKPFFYRIVRHPNYVGWILIHWMTPVLTISHLLLAAGMTAYIYLGLIFEEKDLIRQFGGMYLDYKAETPKLNPLLYPFKGSRPAMRLFRGTVVVGVIVVLISGFNFVHWVKTEMAMMRSDDPGIWQAEIQRLQRENLPKCVDTSAVLFVGSSSFRFWKNIERDLHPIQVINNGFGGAKITDILHYREELIFAFQPRKLVLFIGTNDISGSDNDKSPTQVAGLYRELIRSVQNRLPECEIYFLPITPTLARWKVWPQAREANQLMKKLALSTRGVHFLNCTDDFLDLEGRPVWKYYKWDGTHLTREGYRIWSERLKGVLVQGENPTLTGFAKPLPARYFTGSPGVTPQPRFCAG